MPMRSHSPNRRTVVTVLAAGLAAGLFIPVARGQLALTRRNLAGVWRGIEKTAGIVISGEVIFQPNGTYRRMHQFKQLMTWASGPYTIAENWIHFEVDAYGPVYYLGAYQYPPPSETWMVDQFDGQSISGWIGSASQIYYERVS